MIRRSTCGSACEPQRSPRWMLVTPRRPAARLQSLIQFSSLLFLILPQCTSASIFDPPPCHKGTVADKVTYMYMYMCVCVYTCTRKCVCVYICTPMYVHGRVCTNVYTHTHTYIYIYTHMSTHKERARESAQAQRVPRVHHDAQTLLLLFTVQCADLTRISANNIIILEKPA